MVRLTRHSKIRRHPLGAALMAALFAHAAPAALAQAATQDDDPQAEAAASAEQDESATTLDKIVVTGSRLGRDVFNSVSPVQVITREETTIAGFNSTAAALQSNQVTAGAAQINNAFSGFVTNGGPGANTLSLRGLGPQRTLVLLNGRRIAPAGSRGAVGQSDLNVLPNSIVNHVEILKDGASSIYGSDAVAGVVNILTQKTVDDFRFEAQHNVTEHGGGDERRYSLVFGTAGERSRFSGSYEFFTRNELRIGDRDWAGKCPTNYLRDPDAGGHWGSGDYIDPLTGQPKCWTLDANGVTLNTIGTSTMPGVPAPGTSGASFNRWRPNAAVTQGLVGFEGVSLDSRDTFHPDLKDQSLISPMDTHTLFLQGDFDLNQDHKLYYEVLGNRRSSLQNQHRQLTLDYAVGSPLIPANLADSRFSGPTEITNGQPNGVRVFASGGLYKAKQDVDFWRVLAGVEGRIFGEWRYDLGLMKSRSDAEYVFELFLTDRLAQSLDVVGDGSGGFVCRDPSGGCVAAPALNTDTIAGRFPQPWYDWIKAPVVGTTLYEESTVSFNLSGPVFDLPHGTVRGAFGVEAREAEIDDTPSIHMVNGNVYSFSSAAPTRGKDSVWEVYGELEFPLLSGVSFARELTLNLSGRYTDYDSYGDDTTYKIGALWTPVDWLSLRSSYGTSYRAPALFEQFLGATTGFLASNNDPCNDYGQRPPTSPRYLNCQSEGLPLDWQARSSVEVVTLGGAETGLSAETSEALTAGLVLQPDFGERAGRFSFAADYFDIQVDNGIARVGAPALLGLCYNSPNADFVDDVGYCGLVSRQAVDGQLTVLNGSINIATNIVRGWDFTARYERGIGAGTFRATAQVTRYSEQSGRTFADDPLRDNNGNITVPDKTGQLDLTYRLGKWRYRYGIDWVAATDSYAQFGEDPDESIFKLYTPNYFTSSAAVEYSGDTWTIRAGMRNMFDKDPPTISNGIFNTIGNTPLYSGYDYFGRSYFVNVGRSF